MPEETNPAAARAELLRHATEQHAQLEALLSGLSEADMLLPELDDGWSVKDHLAHITWWERASAMVLTTGGSPFADVPGGEPARFTREAVARINAHVFATNRERPLADVRAAFAASYHDMLHLIEALPDTVIGTAMACSIPTLAATMRSTWAGSARRWTERDAAGPDAARWHWRAASPAATAPRVTWHGACARAVHGGRRIERAGHWGCPRQRTEQPLMIVRHNYRLDLTTRVRPEPPDLQPGLLVRSVTPKDLELLWARCCASTAGRRRLSGPDSRNSTEELRRCFDGGDGQICFDCSFLCLLDGAPVAALAGRPARTDTFAAEVYYVMTHPKWKCTGLGAMLLGASLDTLQDHGQTEAWAAIPEGDVPSERLFERAGFVKVKREEVVR